MNIRRTAIAGGAALALLAGGTAAGAVIASSGPVSSGVIHGCYLTKANSEGSHTLVLQNAGTSCPQGYTAISWYKAAPVTTSPSPTPTGTPTITTSPTPTPTPTS